MKIIIHILSKITFKKAFLLSLSVIALVYTPHISLAQSIKMGTVADFILFSTNGAVTNTGLSQFTGNVGANKGPISGFGNVNGVMHNQDGASAASAADLLSLYDQLNFTTPTFFPSVLLGNGDTLVAGVYKIFSKATLNGHLFLDGKGNSNAVFIFQIEGALSTGAASKVILINGAQACNVFWKVEGLVDMATKTYMRGTVVANNAAMKTSTLDSLEGRFLTTTGAITIDGSMTYIPTGCNSPILTGPKLPVLGATACYGLFSGNGQVTNTGVTYITGDVGTNVGLAAGFDALKITGQIHSKPDVSTAACAADLQSMYDYINVLAPDIELLYPAQFGNNLVLTPHTYLLNTATAFTDTLYLNAQGNADGVFVIKVNGALTTGAFSRVVLMNGTQAKNVFWQVEGAANIANNSVFYGTLICNNAAIGLTIGDSIYGRALTTNGALSTVSLVSAIPKGTCSAPLPIDWVYFKGSPVQQNVLLQWSTKNDLNNHLFTIERSNNGNDYTTIDNIIPIVNHDNTPSIYSYTDMQAYPFGYYRISKTDNDGQKTFSNIIKVQLDISEELQVQSYVEGSLINIKVSGAVSGKGIIGLYGIDGKIIKRQEVILTDEPNVYQIPKPTNKGVYIITIESNGVKLHTGKVMVL